MSFQIFICIRREYTPSRVPIKIILLTKIAWHCTGLHITPHSFLSEFRSTAKTLGRYSLSAAHASCYDKILNYYSTGVRWIWGDRERTRRVAQRWL